MINTKSPQEIEIMTEGGAKLSQILGELANNVQPGITTLEIDTQAERLLLSTGGEPSFKKVPGYKFSTCTTVNEEVVHGLPTKYVLKDGDILSIDIGLFYKGFHTDTSVTIPVGKISPETQLFIEAGRKSLKNAVTAAKSGGTVWDISHAMEIPIKENGFSPVTSLTGHGIGKNLHEEPSIPCFTIGSQKHSAKLGPGMCLAIETIYNKGSAEVIYKNEDNWTISTRDHSLSGLFEVTVAITSKGTRILTPLLC